MNTRQKYALTSLLTYILGVLLLIYGAFALGVFSKDKIVVTTLATTGPDYKVVFGQFKLKMQIPDSIDASDVSGLMLTGQGANDLADYLGNNYLAFTYGDYFILTGKIVGYQKSDSFTMHPLFKISSWQTLSNLTFWIFVSVDIALFLLFGLFYKKYRRN